MVLEAAVNAHIPVSRLKRTIAPGPFAPTRHDSGPLVSDAGDDHEIAEDFGNSLTRAGDRIAGFVFGAGLLALAWALCLLI